MPYSSDTAATPGSNENLRGAAHPNDLSLPLYGASFGQAVKRFFYNYANFKGRASRSEYWFVYLFITLLTIIPSFLHGFGMGMVMAAVPEAGPYDAPLGAEAPGIAGAFIAIGVILMGLIALAVFLPQIALTWRRLHDANYPGPLWFVGFVPVFGPVIMIVLMIMPPKPEGQRFDA